MQYDRKSYFDFSTLREKTLKVLNESEKIFILKEAIRSFFKPIDLVLDERIITQIAAIFLLTSLLKAVRYLSGNFCFKFKHKVIKQIIAISMR